MTASASSKPAAGDGSYTRDQVAAALIAAGNNTDSTDADIRRLTTVHIHMISNDLQTIDAEILEDQTIKLLDYFIAHP